MAASASIVRVADRQFRGVRFALMTGAGPALLAITLAGWVLLFWTRAAPIAPHQHAGGAGLHLPPMSSWLVMLLAMMPMALTHPIEHVWTQSLRRTRWRRAGLFGLAYFGVWATAGGLLVTSVGALVETLRPFAAPALTAGLVAVLWQISPAKQRCLNRCHAMPPLPALGWAADGHAVRFGLAAGAWCLGACWALMVLPIVAGEAHALVMAAAMTVTLVERHAPGRRPVWRLPVVHPR